MAEVDKSIGESLRRIRKDKRVGQMELSRLSGVSQGGISAIELGKREAYPSTLEKLADALDVSVAEFFLGGDPHKVPPTPRTRLASSAPEAIETRLYGAPAAEIEGELRPVLGEPEARKLSDAARGERDALEDWLRRYAVAPESEKLARRADAERVRELRERARFYHDLIFNYWTKLYDPRPVPFKGAREFAGEMAEARTLFRSVLENEAERERIERSGEAG